MGRRGENIYKRKDGRYEGRYIKRYDISGKPIYASVYAKNYNDVKDKLVKCKLNEPPEPAGSSSLLSEWLDVWIETDSNIKETTKRLYKRNIQNHIVPNIGNVQLKKLSGDRLQSFVSSLNLSPSTVQLVFTVLKSALTCAEDRGLISNVWSKVKLPKKINSEVIILTRHEQNILENVLCEKNDIGILICLYTGVRIGELCALKWQDIDFEKAVIHIKGTQSRIDNELKVTAPKSRASLRTIPIPEFLIEKLKAHKNRNEFVLSNKGKAVETRTYRRRLKKLLEDAGLPDIKFHALRHTFASRALEVGMDYKTLSEILGHASVSITMDLYVHSLDEHKKNQMNKLNQLFNLKNQ